MEKQLRPVCRLDEGIEILYEDAHILVCFKPAGLPVQSANVRRKDMTGILKLYRITERMAGRGCAGRKGGDSTSNEYLGVVHRLDQPVQGIVVFAKTKKAAASLSMQMSGNGRKRAEKRYYAVVCKEVPDEFGELVDYLKKDGRTNTSQIVAKETPGAKESRLRYRVLARKDGRSLLEVLLLTGRHHQIRVQLAGAGMPIAGDQKYHPAAEREMLGLCAYSLKFDHPDTGVPQKFSVHPQGSVFEIFADTAKVWQIKK